MKYYEAFKAHAIPGIKKAVCNAEQKIAYNFMFSYRDITKSKALDCIQNTLIREQQTTFKKYDIDLIYHYILQSYERYIKHNKSGILTSFEEIGNIIFSDVFKAE